MSNTTRIDFRTPKQRERDIRDKRICDKYVELKAAYPNESISRIAVVIAGTESVSPACVKAVLSKYRVI